MRGMKTDGFIFKLLLFNLFVACSSSVFSLENDSESKSRIEIENLLQKWPQDFNAKNTQGACGLFAGDLIASYPGTEDKNYNVFFIHINTKRLNCKVDMAANLEFPAQRPISHFLKMIERPTKAPSLLSPSVYNERVQNFLENVWSRIQPDSICKMRNVDYSTILCRGSPAEGDDGGFASIRNHFNKDIRPLSKLA